MVGPGLIARPVSGRRGILLYPTNTNCCANGLTDSGSSPCRSWPLSYLSSRILTFATWPGTSRNSWSRRRLHECVDSRSKLTRILSFASCSPTAAVGAVYDTCTPSPCFKTRARVVLISTHIRRYPSPLSGGLLSIMGHCFRTSPVRYLSPLYCHL